MVVGRFEAAATQRAASLQDEFDRVYLGLPLGLPLDKPNESIVANLRACSDTSPEKLGRRWYPDLEGSDPGTAALAIQRMNLTWDVAQRKWMTGLSISAGFCWFLTGLALWKQSSWTVSDFLLIWMGPAVAVWELSVTSAYRHYDLAAAKADLAEVADDGLKGWLLDRATALALADLIQAQMKELRAVAPPRALVRKPNYRRPKRESPLDGRTRYSRGIENGFGCSEARPCKRYAVLMPATSTAIGRHELTNRNSRRPS